MCNHLREEKMKRRIFGIIGILFLANLLLWPQIPEGYYSEAEGKTGYRLKTALHNIIRSHKLAFYNELYEYYKTTDSKPGNIVWDMYSDIPDSTPPYTYMHMQRTCGNYSKEGDCYNREHVLPQSWFRKAYPMKSDLFHVYPTDGKVNGKRSSFPFGEVRHPHWKSRNGSELGPCSFPGYSGTVFEPIDAYKGDIARVFFYMATRYEHKISGWKKGTAREVLDGSRSRVFHDWVVALFLEWHHQDPVSRKEIDRNDAVYKIQFNRNPFIDHPEFVELIWNQGDTPDDDGEEPCMGVTLFAETFAECPENWGFYSVSGSKDWECHAEGYVSINAYRGRGECDDWLICPALNLDEYHSETLTFKTWTRYVDSFYPPLKVKYSTNYTGGNPYDADWSDLTAALSSENSQYWTSSGSIKLHNIRGTSVHIAFKYTSSGTGSGSSSSWRLDDVVVTGKVKYRK